MVMSSSTLSGELEAMAPTDDLTAAKQALAEAFATMISEAQALSPIVGATVTANCVPACVSALTMVVGGSAADAATAIQTAYTAIWTTIVGTPALYFSGAIAATPPPGLSGIGASLASTLASNLASKASLADAAAAMASVIYAASSGGTVTTPGTPPIVTPIT